MVKIPTLSLGVVASGNNVEQSSPASDLLDESGAALQDQSGTTLLDESGVSSGGGVASSVYWGAWIGAQFGTPPPYDMTSVTDWVAFTGKQPSIINWSTPFHSGSAYYNFDAVEMGNIRSAGMIPLFSWGNTPGTGAFTCAAIAGGSQDTYINAWASACAAWGHPMFLRFAWEMNGTWMPWRTGSGNSITDWVAMWQHVHDRFVANGATNVSWVWCPNVDEFSLLTPLATCYPGDAYVDWTGLDGYNWGTNPDGNASGWETFNQIYSSTYAQITETIAPSKPFMIGEIGCTEFGGDKAAWITDLFTQLETNYPLVKALVWFDKYPGDSDNDMDWSITSSAPATAAFAAGIADSRYLANTFGSTTASPIPAL